MSGLFHHRGADASTDHQLLVATMKIKLKAFRSYLDTQQHKYNVQFLSNVQVKEEFNCKVKNKFEALAHLDEEVSIDNHWNHIEDMWKTVCTDVLGKKKREQKEWMTHTTWELIKPRKMLKQRLNQTHDTRGKLKRQKEYWNVNKGGSERCGRWVGGQRTTKNFI